MRHSNQRDIVCFGPVKRSNDIHLSSPLFYLHRFAPLPFYLFAYIFSLWACCLPLKHHFSSSLSILSSIFLLSFPASPLHLSILSIFFLSARFPASPFCDESRSNPTFLWSIGLSSGMNLAFQGHKFSIMETRLKFEKKRENSNPPPHFGSKARQKKRKKKKRRGEKKIK